EANVSVEECLATVLGAEMVSLARALMDKEEDPQKRWEQLCQVNKELARLRWARARDSRRSINEERWKWERAELEREENERKQEWLKKQQLAPLELLPERVGLLAQCKGGGEHQMWKAARILELRHDLPKGRLQMKDGGWWHWTGAEWEWVVDPTFKVRAARANKKESGNGKKKAGKPSKSKRKASKKHPVDEVENVEHPTSNNQEPTSNGKKREKEEENGKTSGDDVCQTIEQPVSDDGAQRTARPTIKEPSSDASVVAVENDKGQAASSPIKVNQGGF
ncbi:MAG TPA: hypothetical protein VH255_01515, partial [Verrucomicrobiae bacterium]|nr:hypothetical protein [Verrucomicrobiae bacterium]